MKAQELGTKFLEIQKNLIEGVKWLNRNPDPEEDKKNNAKELRRMARNLSDYADALDRKPGVAVFGASQAGKSILISSLGSGPSGSLTADFDQRYLDFAKQINPEGGGETTALVTRFSLDSPPKSPDPEKPVCFKLFSEMDIIKILANTFFADAQGQSSDKKNETQELAKEQEDLIKNIESVLNVLKKDNKSDGRPLSEDDLEDLEFYIKEHILESIYGRILHEQFWKRAWPLAGKNLNLDARASFFSFLWGQNPEFTKLYKLLYKILESLDFPERAYCALKELYDPDNNSSGQALARDNKEYSLLKVDRLNDLFSPGILEGKLTAGGPKSEPPVDIIADTEKKATLPRSILCALIAEFYLKIKDKSGDYQEKADLLDFPGYRTRLKTSGTLKDPSSLSLCFRRGKVAYLFERYRDRREIAALFFCIPPSTQEDDDLTPVVTEWINGTIGSTPIERSGQPLSLFLVLTKFDDTMKQSPSMSNPLTKWENRLSTSFEKITDPWLNEWSLTDRGPVPFTNVFWMMNIFYAKDSYWTAEEKQIGLSTVYVGKGVREEKKDYIDEAYQGYLNSQKVKKYIRDPEKAWDAVVNGPDGGAGYLLENLNLLLANPDLHLNQLSNRAKERTAEVVDKYLRKRCKWLGVEDEQRKLKENFYSRFKEKINHEINNRDERRFAEFLLELQIDYCKCKEIFNESLTIAKTNPSTLKSKDTPGKISGNRTNTPHEGQSGGFKYDFAYYFRHLLEQRWQEQLAGLTVNEEILEYFFFKDDRQLLKEFLSELQDGANRLKIFHDMEESLRKASNYSGAQPDDFAWKLARIAAADISEFVNWLGLSPRKNPNPTVRTVPDPELEETQETRLIFEPPPNPGRVPELGEAQGDIDITYYKDWLLAFHNLLMNNMGSDNMVQEEDSKLQTILTDLDKTIGSLP